jgi:hypothetical protein
MRALPPVSPENATFAGIVPDGGRKAIKKHSLSLFPDIKKSFDYLTEDGLYLLSYQSGFICLKGAFRAGWRRGVYTCSNSIQNLHGISGRGEHTRKKE